MSLSRDHSPALDVADRIGAADSELTLRETLLSPEELASNLEISPATLATWRCLHVGPPFLKVGRKIWYPKERVNAWLAAKLQKVTWNSPPMSV